MFNSKEYRRMAAEAYRMAKAAPSDTARAKYLEVAKSWDDVAKEAERLEAKRQEWAA